MGYYTQFVFAARLDADLPRHVREVLEAMCCEGGDWPIRIGQVALPGAPFFCCPRWQSLFRGANGPGHYQTPLFKKVGEEYRLHIRSEFKNYDGEIGHFLGWIMRYVDEAPGAIIGCFKGEDDLAPTEIKVPEEGSATIYKRPRPTDIPEPNALVGTW